MTILLIVHRARRREIVINHEIATGQRERASPEQHTRPGSVARGRSTRQDRAASKSRRQAGQYRYSFFWLGAGGSDVPPADHLGRIRTRAARVNQEGKEIFAVILLSAAARPQAGSRHARHGARAYFPLLPPCPWRADRNAAASANLRGEAIAPCRERRSSDRRHSSANPARENLAPGHSRPCRRAFRPILCPWRNR
jgi:hypothetical protein